MVSSVLVYDGMLSYRWRCHHNPEDPNLNFHSNENVESHILHFILKNPTREKFLQEDFRDKIPYVFHGLFNDAFSSETI